jgi:hypothetical protein
MFFSKKVVIPIFIILALATYYSFQAPAFKKSTSTFAIWGRSVIDPASKKGTTSKLDITITAKESAQAKYMKFVGEDEESSKQVLRLITLCIEAGFSFKEHNVPPQTFDDGWIIQIEDAKNARQFYATISYDELKNSAAGLNFLQLMHMWSK